jgi:hypothetical protein
MFDSRLRHSFAMMASFKERFKELILDTIVHVNVKLKESAVMGKTVGSYDKYCRGAKDYMSLARELITSFEGSIKEEAPKVRPAAKEQREEQPQVFSERMQEIVRQEIRQMLPVKFILEAPGARSVYVTGSFNDWSLDEQCRLRENSGRWETNLSLEPGVYKYQFIVDGVWREDPSNPLKERNSFGDINSLIEVKTGVQSANN